MKVSIITVVFNRADTIGQCIESVLAQTYTNIEYIVIDGGSTDGTVDVIRSFDERISQFVSESDQGIYDAMNKGIRLATGDAIATLNADDFYRHTEVITNAVARLEATGADAVYGNMLYVDPNNLATVKRHFWSGPYKPGAFLWGFMPGHPTFIARRWVFDHYGVYSLALKTAADYELMLRFIHKHGISLSYIDDEMVVMRAGGASNGSLIKYLRANREDHQAWRMNGLTPYFFTRWIKPFRKIGQFFVNKYPQTGAVP